jgi:hypothetical protein
MDETTAKLLAVGATTMIAIARQLGESPEGNVALAVAEELQDSSRHCRLTPGLEELTAARCQPQPQELRAVH